MWNQRTISQVKFLIEKGFDMKSEVILNNESKSRVIAFGDLRNGEGTVECDGHLRLRLSDNNYLHFSVEGETMGVDDKDNWPPDLKTKQPIRKFRLIAEEI